MGSCFSEETRIEPRELEDLNGDSDDGGKIERNREVTDKFSFGMLAVYLLIFSGLVIYTATKGDINRLLNGYDDCGNICGLSNKVIGNIDCSGGDMLDKKYLLVQNISGVVTKECVKDCSRGYKVIFHRCVKVNGTNDDTPADLQSVFKEFSHDLYMSWVEILCLCLLALVYSIIMVVLFRFATKFVVWFMLIGGALVFVAVTIILWITWSQKKKEVDQMRNATKVDHDEVTNYLIVAIFATIFTVAILLIILVMRKKIQLVIQLIKEAGKAIAPMPFILFEPILTFVSITLGAMIWFYFILVSTSAGTLTKISPKVYDYVDNGVVSTTVILSILTALWMFYFIVDCQHMIIAGSISRWFFTRNKNNLGSPIYKSAYTTIRYHLGTIALGSLIVTLFMIIKAIIKSIINSVTKGEGSSFGFFIKCCVNWCLETIEDLLKYFTRNAYIITAIYGFAFCESGKRAFNVIKNNVFKIIAINSVGDFVLNLAKFFILVLTLVVGYEVLKAKKGIESYFAPLVLIAIFAFCIAHMFMTVYEMAIDTIFICFCEDYEENDGLSKPFYMSKELMEFVENSHKFLDKGHENEQAPV